MKYIVSLADATWENEQVFVGEGTSEEEAIEDCLAKVRDHLSKNVMIELAEGLVLPKDVAMKMPSPPPEGFALLIIKERARWGGGYTFSAIPEDECEGMNLKDPVLWGSVHVFQYYSDNSGDTDHLDSKRSLYFEKGVWK